MKRGFAVKRLLLAGLSSFLFAFPVSADQLDVGVVSKVKAATVFVKLPVGTGSGFLFRKSGTTGYLITCEHVVGNAQTVEIVFNSGCKDEKVCAATVVATDPSCDLACLMIKGAEGLPSPLELGTKTTVTETENVFVAGFPFGEMLSAARRNPEISLTKVTVSSIRKDDYGDVAVVQLSGDVNPGNSGGPAVDAGGRIVGVAQSKIAIGQTSFFVPPESIRGFLKGRIKSVTFTEVSQTGKVAKFQARMELADPLATLQSVGIAYIRQEAVEALKEEPQADKNGLWHKVLPEMKEISFKISEDRTVAEASFELARGDKDAATVDFCFQSCYTRADGSKIWTAPGTSQAVFQEGPSSNASSAVHEEPKDLPVVEGKPMPIPDSLEVAAAFPLRSVIGGMFLSPDGNSLFVLDVSDGRVLKLDAATLKLVKEVPAPDGALAMTMTPDGSRLYVAATLTDTFYGAQKEAGSIQVISTKDMGVLSTLTLDQAPMDIAATDKGLVAVSVSAQWEGLVIMDAEKKTVSGKAQMVYGRSRIHLHPDQSRVYTGDQGISPPNFHCVPMKKDPKSGYACYNSPYHGDYPLGNEFAISPDGRFLMGSGGTVLRLSRSQQADMRYAAKIDPFLAAAFAQGCSTFLTSNAEGFLKVYSLDNLELQKSVKMGRICPYMVLDPRHKFLFAAAGAVFREGADPYRNSAFPILGDIVAFSLAPKDEKKP